MTINELKKYNELGNLPLLVDCKKEYSGICRMVKITKNNIVFLDYGDSAVDSKSEGGFRVRFKYDTFENMVHSIEDFTGKIIDKWEPNKYDENDFDCKCPDFEALKSDVYNNKISFLKNYIEFSIGDIYWNGLYLREISPQSTMSEIELWVSKISCNKEKVDTMEYKDVQNIAKETMSYIKTVIAPEMKLTDVRKLCEDKMRALGADSFWYWDIGAFVFSGDETAVSVSGREYVISDKLIGFNDIITIDLSPQNNNIWGDYARTIVIENGSVIDCISDIKNDEWRSGLLMEERLHKELIDFATSQTSFEELYYHINSLIVREGYVNLDFMGNLGHSIVKDKNERVYIEKENKMRLSEVDYFTFEPHISIQNSKYGYKKENIYYFSDNKLIEL